MRAANSEDETQAVVNKIRALIPDQRGPDIIRKLARSFLLPFRQDALGVQRRKLLLDPILELKVQSYFPVAVLLSQNRSRLTRVMITVVKEKDDFSADLFLEPARRQNLSE